MMKDKTEKNILKKKRKKTGESPTPGLISQTCNSWNPRLELNSQLM
jgi:hypothetical protein